MKKKLLLLIVLSTLNGWSQSGEIDTTFGTNGKVITGLGNNRNAAMAIANQPDGKFLVGGTYMSTLGHNDFALTRYNSDGSLDSGFGINGRAVTDFLELNNNYSYINAVYILPTGKILVCGTTGFNYSSTVAIVRYNVPGTIDTGFGTNGKIISELRSFENYGNKIILLGDGKFLFTGVKGISADNEHIGIERYTEDGTLDSSFGTNGQAVISFGTGKSWPTYLALKPDGKIVVAGKYPAFSPKIAVAQFNSDGTPDTSFDGDGKVITTFGTGTTGIPMELSINEDGKIKLAALVGTTVTNFALVQYNLNGSLDTSFDGDGKSIIPLPQVEFDFTITNSMFRQPDGKYLVVFDQNFAESSDFLVRRYNGDASVDMTFGIDGTVSTTFGTGVNIAQSATILPNGKIFVVGKSQPIGFGSAYFAIAKYNSDGTLDTSLDVDGKLTTSFENGNDELSHLLVQPDDKLIAVGVTQYYQSNGSFARDIVLSRYSSDGALDPTFGTLGKVRSEPSYNVNLITAAALQSDAKIVIGNIYSSFLEPSNLFELIRYNANGSVDTTFGTNGKVATNYYTSSIAFLPDGKILAAGGGIVDGIESFFLRRYNSNGTLDSSFDTDGHVPISFGNLPSGNPSVMIQPDGKIIFTGGSYNANLGNGTFAVARFNSDGSADASFGNNGQTVTPLASGLSLKGFLQADGKIIIAGLSNGFSTVRYNTNGTIDTAYGTSGITTTDLNIDSYLQLNSNSIQLQADGKFLVALAKYPQDSTNNFKIKRVNPDGTFDVEFGGQDGITTSFYDGYDEAFAIGLQSDDKIVVAGSTHNGISKDFALTRYANSILAVEHFTDSTSGLVIYPNPVKDILYIKTSDISGIGIINYNIYNMLGQLIYKNTNGNPEVHTTNFSKGIYNILINTNKGMVSKKFIRE